MRGVLITRGFDPMCAHRDQTPTQGHSGHGHTLISVANFLIECFNKKKIICSFFIVLFLYVMKLIFIHIKCENSHKKGGTLCFFDFITIFVIITEKILLVFYVLV